MDIGIFNKAYLYLNYGKKSIIIENKYTLKDEINSSLLRKALQNIIGRFHYFKLKPIIDINGKIDCTINNSKIDVYEQDDKIYYLGTKETNNYLFKVAYKENNIYISLSHAIADARGALLFGNSLIYEYLKLIGVKIEADKNLITNETPIEESETEILKGEKAKINKKNNFEESFIIPVDYKYFNTEYEKKIVIKWNAKEFSNLIHKLECTPVSLFTAIIGNAIYKNYKIEGKKVSASIPVDLRKYFQSKAQSNFISSIKLDFKEEYKDLPIEDQVKKIKNELKKRLKLTNFREKTYETEEVFKSIIDTPIKSNIEYENLSDRLEIFMNKPEATYMISNIGIINIPKQMQDYITDYEITTSNTTLSTLYTLITIGDVGKLIITQNDDSKIVINEIRKFFIENGMKVQVEDYGKIRMDFIAPYKFEMQKW